MKKLLALTLTFLTACCTIKSHKSNDAYSALWDSVIFIRGTFVDKNTFSVIDYTGSGVVICHRNGNTYILTAAHVGERDAFLEVKDNLGNIHKVIEVIQHRSRDVALLKVEGVFGKAIPVWHGSPLRPSSPAWIVGFPVGIKIINDGRIIGYSNDGFVMFSCGCAPGLSGGGLFVKHNDTWYLYGIVSRIPVVKIFQIPNGVWFMGMAESFRYCEELLKYIGR